MLQSHGDDHNPDFEALSIAAFASFSWRGVCANIAERYWVPLSFP